MSTRAAVFLDRDGTLIEDRGYLRSEAQVVFYPETVPALRHLQERDFALIIVTNQGGVAKGELTSEEAALVNEYVVRELAKAGITIEAVYCCPHQRGDGCECIKPKRHFLDRAAQEHGIDLRRSFSVGDHPHDVAFAQSAGGKGIFVLSGHGRHHIDEVSDCPVVENIAEAVDWILSQAGEA